ncbi:hypothetical protein SADO_05005 [Salinisphaera dokdonensis CL-ES53]|uniref:Putative Flp pilus-assembly TadG-like N-terminal domain-containing protein n=1 Tax=Salinisphaera dokdonensis CL-ES53 TaxID=1304272 RepID=A0ABV2AZ19_9GAMM
MNPLASRRPHRQRGAILIMTAAFIVAAVALLALAVDTGRLYATQQKLQSAANIAALDAARVASGCRVDLDSASGLAAAQASVTSNFARRDEDTTPTITRYDEGLVTTNQATGLRQFATDAPVTTRPNGVRLTVTDDSYAPLFSLFSDNEITLSASAGAIAQPEAAIQFGTTLAAVNPDLLSALIDVDLEVASLGDLANASVTLADLLDIDAGVATSEDVARVTVNEALDNVSDGVNALARGVIGDVRSALGDQPLSEILSLAGPVGSDASVALGNIVNAAAQLVAVDREEAISLPTILSELPANLGGLDVSLRLLEPAGTEIGPAGTYDGQNYYTVVRSSQASLSVDLALRLGLGGLLDVAEVNLPIAIQLAQGEARLERIDCPTPDDRFYTVTVSADTATAAAAIGSVNPDGSINTGARADVTVLGTTVAELFNDGDAVSTVLGNDRYEAVFDDIDDLALLPQTFEGDQTVRTNDIAGLLGDINLDYDLLNTGGGGGLLGGIFDGLGDLLTGLTRPLLRAALDGVSGVLETIAVNTLGPVLDPLLDGLGISLASPTITLAGLTPNQPALFCASSSDCGFEAEDGS